MPIGNDFETYWSNLQQGVTGTRLIKSFDASEFEVRIAAEVQDFDPASAMDPKMARRMSRFIHFAMGAGKQAVADSGIDFAAMTPEQRDRCGVIVNTGGGGIEAIIDGTHVHDHQGPPVRIRVRGPGPVGLDGRLPAVHRVRAHGARDDPGRRVCDVGDRVPRRAAADRDRRVRRRPGRRIGGADRADGRCRAVQHDRALEAQRLARDGIPAVRQDPGRVRARRGRRGRRRRVGRARARAVVRRRSPRSWAVR